MTDLKTTVSGVIGGIVILLNFYLGWNIPSEAIIGIALALIGYFAKDKDKKPTPSNNIAK